MDEDDSLCDYYDCIVLGTGQVESIAACALQLSGKKVLHLDTCDYYGRNDTNLNLAQIFELCRSGILKETNENADEQVNIDLDKAKERFVEISPDKSVVLSTIKFGPQVNPFEW